MASLFKRPAAKRPEEGSPLGSSAAGSPAGSPFGRPAPAGFGEQAPNLGRSITAPVAVPRGSLTRPDFEAEVQFFFEELKRVDEADRERVFVPKRCPAEDDLNSYSILGGIDATRKAAFVEAAADDPALDRAMGSMVGMGVGDALGHPFEFMPAQDRVVPGSPHFNPETFAFHGESNTFRLMRGQWTDDAAMGLCMADSLLLRERFDGSDMRVRFWCWWNRGYNNAFRHDRTRSQSVGLGGNIAKSLMAISQSQSRGRVPEAYEAQTEDAGNGSLMRFTPIALFLHSTDWDTVYDCSRRSSRTTHPGIIAAEACSLLGHLIVAALRLPPGERNARAFLEQATLDYYRQSGLQDRSGWGYDQMKQLVLSKPEAMTESCWNWKREQMDISGTLIARGSRYNGYPVSAGYFGSYSLDGLALALWAVYHSTSFTEAVTKSVNLLGDADSHGSITGQLAGAIYGYRAIDARFLKWLNPWDDHEFATRAVLLHRLGARLATSPM